MSTIPCFLCIQDLSQRNDKNKKPYFICDSCGVQIFVRGRQGIKNLSELIAALREREFAFRENSAILYEIQGILTEIRGIEKEIESLNSVIEILIPNSRKERTRELLRQRVETLLGRLELIAKGRSKG